MLKTFAAVGINRGEQIELFSATFDRALEHLMEENVGVDAPEKRDILPAMKTLGIQEYPSKRLPRILPQKLRMGRSHGSARGRGRARCWTRTC